MLKWYEEKGNCSDVVISTKVRLSRNLKKYPFSTKIKCKLQPVLLMKQIIIDGILSIQAGESPALIERKLNSYILDSHLKDKG